MSYRPDTQEARFVDVSGCEWQRYLCKCDEGFINIGCNSSNLHSIWKNILSGC